MAIDPETVRQVASLARLRLDDAEVARAAQELTAILDYVAQLDALDTEGVVPLAHPLPLENVFRADEPAPSLPVDAALANAPKRTGDYFGVPAVLDTSEAS